VPPKYYSQTDAAQISKTPVGSGPFKFVRWIKDDRVVLEANESYRAGSPSFKTLIFRPIPDMQTRLAALQAGEVDVVTNVPPSLVKQITSNPNLSVAKVPSVRIIHVQLYTHQYDASHKVVGPVDGPTKDKRRSNFSNLGGSDRRTPAIGSTSSSRKGDLAQLDGASPPAHHGLN
jgi:peptide/nickel transport system substrate-binding protein